MSDLISRQAAIYALERKKDKNANGDIGGFYNKIIQNDIDALMQLPPAQPEHGRWIPCKESMPTKDGVYLVSGRWASGKEAVGDCDYSKEDGYFHTAWNFDVLAWMPLPKPYKMDEVEEK